jgi:hypothetical protein
MRQPATVRLGDVLSDEASRQSALLGLPITLFLLRSNSKLIAASTTQSRATPSLTPFQEDWQFLVGKSWTKIQRFGS